ncbi:MAG TPA: four helix bundle protein [Candidatus Bathyarchaeia archaeon]|nr:four helix bundle protein [Candidatus Bathyarchaeia archaeon]
MEKVRNFRDLIIWQKGIELVTDIYQLIVQFPKEELYGLVSQIKRSAISIPSNIAEGFNRYHNKEYTHFLHITLGSCAELETQIEISYKLRLINKSIRDDVINNIQHIEAMTQNLIKKLKQAQRMGD